MAQKDELSHIGVLGMRWGHRKSQSEQNLDSMRSTAKASSNARKAEIRKTGKELDSDFNKAMDLFTVGKKDRDNWDKLDATAAKMRDLEAAHKLASKADKSAINDQKKMVKAEGKIAAAQRKLAKDEANTAKWEAKAEAERKFAREEIEYAVSGLKPGKAEAQRARMEKDPFYSSSLHATAKSMRDQDRADKIAVGLGLAGGVLLVVGQLAVNSIANNKPYKGRGRMVLGGGF